MWSGYLPKFYNQTLILKSHDLGNLKFTNKSDQASYEYNNSKKESDEENMWCDLM